MINYDKIKTELEKVQENKRQRTFTIEDIQKLVEMAEQKKAEILKDKLNKKYFKAITFHMREDVCNSYKYAAETTVVWGSISKYGKIIIHIERRNARHCSYGGIDIDFEPIYE